MAFFMNHVRQLLWPLLVCLLALASGAAGAADRRLDSNLLVWIEDSASKRTQDWIAARNAEAARFAATDKRFNPQLLPQARQYSANAAPRLIGSFQGADYAELRVDADNPRGLWRKTSLRSLFAGKPQWQTLLDGAAQTDAPGTLVAADCLPPDYRQCLLFFRTAGGQTALREYDAQARAFVAGGFSAGPAPLHAAWYDENTLLIATDTGAGSLTSQHVPRLVRLWPRGTTIHDARTVFAGNLDDQLVRPLMSLTPGGLFHAVERIDAAGRRALFHLAWAQNLVRADLPDDARFLSFFQGRAMVALNTAWRRDGALLPAGSLIAYPMAPLLGPQRRQNVELAYTPPAGETVIDAMTARDTLFVTLRKGAQQRMIGLRKGAPDWRAQTVHVARPKTEITLQSGSDLGDVVLASVGDELMIAGSGRMRPAGRMPEAAPEPKIHFARQADAGQLPSVLVTPETTAPGQPLVIEIVERSALPAEAAQLSPLIRWHLTNGGRVLVVGIDTLTAPENSARIAMLARAQQAPGQAVVMTASGLAALPAFNAALDAPRQFSALILFDPVSDVARMARLGDSAGWLDRVGNPVDPAIQAKLAQIASLQRITRRSTLPPALILATSSARYHPAHARKLAQRLREHGLDAIYHEASAPSGDFAYALALAALYLGKVPAIPPATRPH